MKKKRFPIRFLALLVPACTVDTPVVEGSNATFDDRLGADLGPWCEAACAKVRDCAPEEEPREDCPDDCYELFATEFVGKGDMCAAGALRLMDCIEGASCRDLSLDVCDTMAEISRCAASNGQVTCESRGGGEGGSAGFGGSAPAGTSTPSCEVQYDECSNGLTYMVSCSGSAPRECECMIAGDYTTGHFRRDSVDCPEAYEAREICGWPIIPHPDEPPTQPPVSCSFGSSSGAAGGGSVGSCEIFFEDCSDGHNYGITCDGSNEACACRVDGETAGSFVTSEYICPYVFDDDSGAATLNNACGFSIMSAIPEL